MRKTSAVVLLGAACGVALTVMTRASEKWDPARAATYLDARQEAWFAWPRAASPDGPCISCHTGMPYLLARPALRKLLHESTPTMYEKGLLSRLQSHAGAEPAGAPPGNGTIFTAGFVAH